MYIIITEPPASTPSHHEHIIGSFVLDQLSRELAWHVTHILKSQCPGIFTIEIRQDESELLISNVLGDKIISKKLTSRKSEIDLSKQPSGIYFISIKSDKGILNRKIFIR